MKKMGALRKLMPITSATFLVGWLAIAGVPPFSGFWSKDEILVSAFKSFGGGLGAALYVVGLVTALLTAYYMTRQIYLVFFGEPRWKHAEHPTETVGHDEEQGQLTTPEPVGAAAHGEDHGHGHGEPHESPATMTIPLLVLAALALVGGALNAPWPGRFSYPLERWLEPLFEGGNPLPASFATSSTKLLFALFAVVAGAAGIAAGWTLWKRGPDQPSLEPDVARKGFYYDSGLAALFGGPGRAAADALAYKVDQGGIDGAVNGVARLVRGGGGQLRKLQTGYVRNYALGITAGAVLLLAYVVVQSR
jgi:NADH-quinone oxidoreductase subunit L